jgi:hypothetical protein
LNYPTIFLRVHSSSRVINETLCNPFNLEGFLKDGIWIPFDLNCESAPDSETCIEFIFTGLGHPGLVIYFFQWPWPSWPNDIFFLA